VDSTGETSAQSVQPLDEGNWTLGVDLSDPLPNPQLIEQAAAPLLLVLIVAHSLGDKLGVDSRATRTGLVDDRPVDPGQSSPGRRLSTPG